MRAASSGYVDLDGAPAAKNFEPGPTRSEAGSAPPSNQISRVPTLRLSDEFNYMLPPEIDGEPEVVSSVVNPRMANLADVLETPGRNEHG